MLQKKKKKKKNGKKEITSSSRFICRSLGQPVWNCESDVSGVQRSTIDHNSNAQTNSSLHVLNSRNSILATGVPAWFNLFVVCCCLPSFFLICFIALLLQSFSQTKSECTEVIHSPSFSAPFSRPSLPENFPCKLSFFKVFFFLFLLLVHIDFLV